MIKKKHIQFIKTLQRKKGRLQAEMFVVEGKKMVEEVVESDLKVETVYSTDEDFVKHNNGSLVSSVQMGQMSGQKNPSGYLAVVKMKKLDQPPINGKVIVLDDIQDPGNLGTILRIADWFGMSGVVLSENTVDEYNPKVVQATMGSLFRVPILRTSLDNFFATWKFDIVGMTLDGLPLQEQSFDPDVALVIGNESNGISDETLAYVQRKVKIEGKGTAESLNAAIATAIITYVVSQ